MIGGLGAVFDLTEPFVGAGGRFADRFGKKLRLHKMRAGAGGEVTAVCEELHTADVDLAVTLNGIFDGAAGLGKSRRIQNADVKFLPM